MKKEKTIKEYCIENNALYEKNVKEYKNKLLRQIPHCIVTWLIFYLMVIFMCRVIAQIKFSENLLWYIFIFSIGVVFFGILFLHRFFAKYKVVELCVLNKKTIEHRDRPTRYKIKATKYDKYFEVEDKKIYKEIQRNMKYLFLCRGYTIVAFYRTH